mgnify:CR=1 FL=1
MEVGGFGITPANDLLFVEDVQLIPQVCTGASVAFDDQGVADFFDCQVDQGRRPEQFGRIWIHTHPGRSAEPSFVDEETFARVFGSTQWAAMFILARHGQTYARLRFHIGPGGEVVIPVEIDYSRPFLGSDHTTWQSEYSECVRKAQPPLTLGADDIAARDPADVLDWWDDDWLRDWDDRGFEEELSPEVGHAN